MNFQDLLTKIRKLDEEDDPAVGGGDGVEAPPVAVGGMEECGDAPKAGGPGMSGNDEILIGEKGMEECGEMGPMASPKQQDNVTMNVSMNGSGSGGIKDLLDILRHIEQGGNDHGNDVVLGMGEEQSTGGFDTATTKPHPHTQGVKAVTATGDDLASKGMIGRHGVTISGSNGLREALVQRLSQHYSEVKGR